MVFIFAEVSDQNFVSVEQEEDKESRLCREKRMKMAAAHDSNKYQVRIACSYEMGGAVYLSSSFKQL